VVAFAITATVVVLSIGHLFAVEEGIIEPIPAPGSVVSNFVPTPTPAPPPSEPRIFSGTGADVIALDDFVGTYVFVVRGNPDARHFSIWGYGAGRNLLVNTTMVYDGIVFNRDQDTSLLEITAHGDWSIEQRSLSEMRTIQTGTTVTGTGDEVLQVLSHGQTATIEGNAGGRHFSIWGHGNRRSLLVNTTNVYSGRVMLRNSYTILEISAVGDWSITFE